MAAFPAKKPTIGRAESGLRPQRADVEQGGFFHRIGQVGTAEHDLTNSTVFTLRKVSAAAEMVFSSTSQASRYWVVNNNSRSNWGLVAPRQSPPDSTFSRRPGHPVGEVPGDKECLQPRVACGRDFHRDRRVRPTGASCLSSLPYPSSFAVLGESRPRSRERCCPNPPYRAKRCEVGDAGGCGRCESE